MYHRTPETPLDIDLVPCFRIEGWPDIARKINPKWISNDEVVNKSIKYYDVVCKTCPYGKIDFTRILHKLTRCTLYTKN